MQIIAVERQMPAFLHNGASEMAVFDELAEEIAVRFDLGVKARALVQEVADLIATQPGGLGGFLDNFRAAGLDVKVASWIGGPSPMALSVREVKMALGDEVIEEISENAAISEGFASGVLGYAIPKVVALLTPGGTIPEEIPSDLLSSPGSVHSFSPPRIEDFSLGEGGGHAEGSRMILPGAALLITLGLFGYVISSGTAGDNGPVPSAATVALNALVASPEASGTVANEADSAATGGSLKSVLRADSINRDFAVKAGWIKNLSEGFVDFGSRDRDSQVPFAGKVFNVGRTRPLADRTWAIASLQSAQFPQSIVAALTGNGAAGTRIASSTSTSKLGSSIEESVNRPNQATPDFPAIIFSANSAKVLRSSLPLLRRIAGQIKQLPSGSVVQIVGYTHGTGAPASNVALSQRRADSVYRVLIHEGVSPSVLSAKGDGSSPSMASNDGMVEGRSSHSMGDGDRPRIDRRVEFHVVQQSP